MVGNLDAVAPVESRSFDLHNERLDLLFLQFLQEFIYYRMRSFFYVSRRY